MALVGSLTGLFACMPQEPYMPGHSTKAPEAADPHLAPSASGSTGTWEHLGELGSFVFVDDRPLPSHGHNPDRWMSTVRANPIAAPDYQHLHAGVVMSTGSILVEEHQTLSGDLGPVYAMVKRPPGFDASGNDWEYLVMDQQGRIQSRGSARSMSLCARCHAEAMTDHLFGPRALPRIPPAPSDSAGAPPEDDATAPSDSATIPGRTHPAPKKKKVRP